jgi:hypothetical protein
LRPTPRAPHPPRPTPQLATTQGQEYTQGLRWSLFQGSQDVPWGTQGGGVVGLTVLKPKFLEQFPDARFTFKHGPGAQRGTFRGVWLNKEHTEWALEKACAGEGVCWRSRVREGPCRDVRSVASTTYAPTTFVVPKARSFRCPHACLSPAQTSVGKRGERFRPAMRPRERPRCLPLPAALSVSIRYNAART